MSLQITHTYRFTALDTLFFRESRPMESIGGSELSSVFPPPIRTLSGALRSCIAESQSGWQWSMLGGNHPDMTEAHCKVKHWIADSDSNDESLLNFSGVWVRYQDERIYPVPAFVVAALQFDKLKAVAYLALGQPQHCDLGNNVRLPELPQQWQDNEANYPKPRGLEEYWVREKDLKQILQGKLPTADVLDQAFIHETQVYTRESRLGIARDNHTRTVQQSMLYQTAHIRPAEGVSFEVEVNDLPAELAFADKANRTGGEGRIAQLKKVETTKTFHAPLLTAQQASQGIILCLLTPYCTNGTWLPFDGGHVDQSEDGCWYGTVNGVAIRVHAMVSGRVQREGGWNMNKHRPRAVKSYLPAGTCWYCSIEQDDIAGALTQLHYQSIGQETHLGRGRLVVGRSPVNLQGVSS